METRCCKGSRGIDAQRHGARGSLGGPHAVLENPKLLVGFYHIERGPQPAGKIEQWPPLYKHTAQRAQKPGIL